MALPEDNKAFVKNVFGSDPLNNAVYWIRDHLEPDQVFLEYQLREWAENNGFKEVEPK